jgi:hypothetical protein
MTRESEGLRMTPGTRDDTELRPEISGFPLKLGILFVPWAAGKSSSSKTIRICGRA